MNKAQLAEALAREVGLTQTLAEETVNATLSQIKKTVSKGEDVTLLGFGSFARGKRQARSGRNPQTGAKIEIPAMSVPRFRPGKEFRELLR